MLNTSPVHVQCTVCREIFTFALTQTQLYELHKGEKLIQNILPELSPDDRELFISHVCGKCFDEMFEKKGTALEKGTAIHQTLEEAAKSQLHVQMGGGGGKAEKLETDAINEEGDLGPIDKAAEQFDLSKGLTGKLPPEDELLRQVEESMYGNDYSGWCLNCGDWTHDSCEPDAEMYECPVCEENACYGAEQLLMFGAFK